MVPVEFTTTQKEGFLQFGCPVQTGETPVTENKASFSWDGADASKFLLSTTDLTITINAKPDAADLPTGTGDAAFDSANSVAGESIVTLVCEALGEAYGSVVQLPGGTH